MTDTWTKLKEWPELYLERLEDAGVARITLNRPDKRNCWNRPLCNAFLESLDIIRADKELKIVITRGAGKVFSSGLDLGDRFLEVEIAAHVTGISSQESGIGHQDTEITASLILIPDYRFLIPEHPAACSSGWRRPSAT